MKSTHRWTATLAAAALTAAATVGCNSNAYDPKANNAELSSYAAQHKYPDNTAAPQSDNVIYGIADNGTITLQNAGDATLSGFQLWVNKSYVLEVNTLAAHSSETFAPELFYNAGGNSLKAEPVSQNWTVQIDDAGKLTTAKGPVKM